MERFLFCNWFIEKEKRQEGKMLMGLTVFCNHWWQSSFISETKQLFQRKIQQRPGEENVPPTNGLIPEVLLNSVYAAVQCSLMFTAFLKHLNNREKREFKNT